MKGIKTIRLDGSHRRATRRKPAYKPSFYFQGHSDSVLESRCLLTVGLPGAEILDLGEPEAADIYQIEIGRDASNVPTISVVLSGPGGESTSLEYSGTDLAIEIVGLEYQDNVIIVGSTDAEKFDLRPETDGMSGVWSGPDYEVSYRGPASVEIDGGGGEDSANLYDTDGDDQVTGDPGFVTFVTPKGQTTLVNVERIHAISNGLGSDHATLGGTDGNDYFKSDWGSDRIYGDTYYHKVTGFDQVTAIAGEGADRAYLTGGEGVDLVEAGPEFARIGRTDGRTSSIEGFDRVYLYGHDGDSDHLVLLDSNGNDTLNAEPGEVKFQGTGFYIKATRFDHVTATSSLGEDRAYVADSSGDETLIAEPTRVMMTGTGFSMTANEFPRVYASATHGSDEAYFFDSANDDTFIGDLEGSRMYGNGFYNHAVGFDLYDATFSTRINEDMAELFAMPGGDYWEFAPGEVDHIGSHATFAVRDLDRVKAYIDPADVTVALHSLLNVSLGSEEVDDGVVVMSTTSENGTYSVVVGRRITDIKAIARAYALHGVADSGAVSVNADWEEGLRGDYYIEQQRNGADLIDYAYASQDLELLKRGIGVIQWGLDQQAANGSFPGTGDPVHSTSMFQEAVGRAIATLDKVPSSVFDYSFRDGWIDGLHRMSTWLVSVDQDTSEIDLEPFTHRYFLRAAGLLQASELTGDTTLDTEAATYLAAGLALQEEDGVMPERGGFDLNYQSLGVLYLTRYARLENDPITLSAIIDAVNASEPLFSSRIDGQGRVDLSDSTRAGELGRSGEVKQFSITEAVRGYMDAFDLTGNRKFRKLAMRLIGFAESNENLVTITFVGNYASGTS